MKNAELFEDGNEVRGKVCASVRAKDMAKCSKAGLENYAAGCTIFRTVVHGDSEVSVEYTARPQVGREGDAPQRILRIYQTARLQ